MSDITFLAQICMLHSFVEDVLLEQAVGAIQLEVLFQIDSLDGRQDCEEIGLKCVSLVRVI